MNRETYILARVALARQIAQEPNDLRLRAAYADLKRVHLEEVAFFMNLTCQLRVRA